jgi:thiamine monophosphate kinase
MVVDATIDYYSATAVGGDLNDPVLLDQAIEAGIVQGARRALTESTSGP